MERDENGRFVKTATRNIARVSCKELADGKIMIVKLDGFLSGSEIKEKYGTEVFRLNKSQDHRMRASLGGVWLGLMEDVYPDQVLTPDYFWKMIAEMKECGAALVSCIRSARKADQNPIKVIEI